MADYQVSFCERINGEEGELIVSGVFFPCVSQFDPLVKLWCGYRKRIDDDHRPHSIAYFKHSVAQKTATGTFALSYAGHEKDTDDHRKAFEDDFFNQMKIFEEIIIKFLDADKNGYDDYCRLVANGGTEKECKRMINAFLRAAKVRFKRDYRDNKDELREAAAEANIEYAGTVKVIPAHLAAATT